MHEARFMQRALELARRGMASTQPNPRVGCVMVQSGEIVGEGFHACAGGAHAEVHALAAAGARARGADVYVNLEPCSHHGRTPPCVDALLAAGVRRVHAAMQDPNPEVAGRGFAHLRAAGVEVVVGEGAVAAHELNRGFISRMTRGRPWVTLKLAASLDGRTAMASGESRWITGAAARADVHRLRAEAGAVLTSSATVLADDPALSAREFATPRQPDRIVLDARGRVAVDAKIWADDGARKFWVCAETVPPQPAKLTVLPAQVDENGQLRLRETLDLLAQHEINEVLVECGPRLAGALLQQNLVDELVLYLAPSLLGHLARSLALLPGLERLDQRIQLHWIGAPIQLGDDLRLTARFAAPL